LTQRELAERVGIEPYTVVSQLESGIGRIQPYQYEDWADALELPIRLFVCEVLRHIDPVAHDLFVPPEIRQASECGLARRKRP
jgi:transcriptional regulator with XRE-family HTH domain